MKAYTKVLSIAGSDSGGGAGIQADIKTISACGGYGMTAITAITAQNTMGVQAIQGMPVSLVKEQINSVVEDIGVDAIKIGMLHSSEIIEAVAEAIQLLDHTKIILDPVMMATSGNRLLHVEAVEALKKLLIPQADLVTPNLPEAEVLLGVKIEAEDMSMATKKLAERMGTSVLVKGGHLPGDKLTDVFYDARQKQLHSFTGNHIATKNTHGTGCSLSSAIATYYGKGTTLLDAVSNGIRFVKKAIEAGKTYQTGNGHGPVHHFHDWW